MRIGKGTGTTRKEPRLNRPDQQLFLGIDAGGTSCRARLETAAGKILGVGTAGSATLRLGPQVAANTVADTCRQAIAASGISEDQADAVAVCAGVAGIEHEGAASAFANELVSLGFSAPLVVSDAETACVGAHAGGDGGIVIIGTGSVGYGRIHGKTIRLGGHGFPITDQGSGAHIGLLAAQKAVAAVDGLIAQNVFLRDIFDAMGGSMAKMVAWQEQASATHYASLAPIVVHHATSNDAAARDVMQTAARDIGRLINGLAEAGIDRISLVGGLASIIEPFLPVSMVKKLVKPKGDPVSGAIILARKQAAAEKNGSPNGKTGQSRS